MYVTTIREPEETGQDRKEDGRRRESHRATAMSGRKSW